MEINDNGGKMPPSSQNLENDLGPKYTIPGILHFIQHEWARFEMDRAHWEVERVELQARIAFLQGERRGQENLKHDLIRRIKMLEFALKQERAKYHRLKYGTDIVQEKLKEELKNETVNDAIVNNSKPAANWRQGRMLLRQYLQEVGYTDSILGVRSSRVRSILGLSAVDPQQADLPIVNSLSPRGKSGDSDEVEKSSTQQQEALFSRVHGQAGTDVVHSSPVRRPTTRPSTGSRNKQINDEEIDSEAAALAGFDFLQNDEDEEENDDDMDDGGSADDESDERDDVREGMRLIKKSKTELTRDVVEEMLGQDETVDAFEEFGFVMNDSSDSDSTVIEADDDEQQPADFDDVNIHMPDDSEKLHHRSEAPTESEKDEWGMDQNLLAKLKEQYRKERKGKKNQKRPARSALQDMLRNLEGDGEIPPATPPTPATQVITGPPPVRLSGSRALSEVPPIGSITVHGNSYNGSSKNQSETKPLSPPADEPVPLENPLGLGELAGLTVSNEAEPLSYEVSSKDEFRKTWNPKFTLRSHFDPIRSLYFHPTESALITASEDHTLKLWNLQKTIPQKKSNVLDVEPIYTFRGHSGPVLSVAINSTGEMCFSGSADATVLCWNIPALDVDPYGPYKASALSYSLVAHTDAVWDLAVQSNSLQLLSCSADRTCRLWSPTLRSPLLQAYQVPGDEHSVPTSVDFVRTEATQMVASYSSAQCIIYDLETASPLVKFDSYKTYNNSPSTQINKVVSHPTLPVVITAHEDRHIRFFDNNTGKQIHSMVAHLDGVTSLAVDPNGLYLLSGSHDCSIRLWNLDSKTCVQEITSHRKKFDESIYDVAFHSNKPYIASAGADGLAKVFV